MFHASSRHLYLAVFFLAAITVASSPGVAAARPFKATLTGNAHPDFTNFPVVTNHETGEGQATHLGRFLWEDDEVAVFSPDGTLAVEGTFTMTAANGDQIFGEFTRSGFIDEQGNLIIHGNYSFTGGTGRFADVTGTGELDAVGGGGPDFPIQGSFQGTIDY